MGPSVWTICPKVMTTKTKMQRVWTWVEDDVEEAGYDNNEEDYKDLHT